ncbi:MAG: endo,4-beta-xylanase [Methylobacteriaceae bacterium]|nr:endo,4-beta-xylanase [Methylobacteriaceae bacterium]
MLSRRETLLGAAGALGAFTSAAFARPGSLLTIGTRKPIPFGAAVRPALLGSDADYTSAILGYCDEIVAEGGFLFSDVHPHRKEFRFEEADRVSAFATANGLGLRGHTLVWYGVMPPWTEEIATAAEAERELVRHIETVMSRYKQPIRSWNVVNEALRDDAKRGSDLRPLIWQRRLGADYIAIALRAARAVDPTAQLVISEYDVEFVGERFRNKRVAFVDLVRTLLDGGVPLDAVGLQGHLKGELEIDEQGLGAFAAEMRKAGLEILVTELDVVDNKLPADLRERDLQVAARAHDFIGAIAAEAPLAGVLTWGITDRYTWVPMYFKRDDGLPNRPLPLDQSYRPKPLMQVLDRLRYGV